MWVQGLRAPAIPPERRPGMETAGDVRLDAFGVNPLDGIN